MNLGLGKSILQNFIKNNSKPILLEVELPTNIVYEDKDVTAFVPFQLQAPFGAKTRI